ncbi:MAG: LamG domain-containing protein [Deltaproteobacteria bacterium]|nr:LamG domain-containing protein [Deltaproteobacteria bacterium]
MALNRSCTEPVVDRLNNQEGALFFDGQDYLDLGENDFAISETNELTIAIWVKTHADGGFIIRKGHYIHPFSIQLTADSRIYAGIRLDKPEYLTSTTSLTHNQWYHVAMTYRNGTMTIYINGQPDVSVDNLLGTPAVTSDITRVATMPVTSPQAADYFIGEMDDVRIYNRALSASDISDLYNN